MKRLMAMLLAAAMACSMTACSSSDGQKSTAEGENGEMIVRVGDFLGETFLYPVKIANAKGFFEEEFGKDNITISIEYLGSGAVMTEALTAGELEMSFLGGQPAFSGISNGNGVKISRWLLLPPPTPVCWLRLIRTSQMFRSSRERTWQ